MNRWSLVLNDQNDLANVSDQNGDASSREKNKRVGDDRRRIKAA